MQPEIFIEANKLWTKFAKEAKDTDLQFSIEIHKKLLDFFQVGDYYYYIFNLAHSEFEFVSKEITAVLGYQPEEVDVPFFVNNIHPEDKPWFLDFESKTGEFFATLEPQKIPNYKVRYDYRIRKKNGKYIRVLQQIIVIQSGGINSALRTFGVHTDISDIKKEGTPVLSFIGLNGEPSYIDVNAAKVFTPTTVNLTSREREILSLVISGKKSEEIASSLYISKQTVDTHRKNLLKKAGCNNTASLISTAVKKGWV